MSISTSFASGSTVTVAVEVWIRPLASVTGTRCTRWVPRLVLQAEVGVGTLDQEDRFVDPVPVRRILGEDLDLPLLQCGEALVHVVEDAREEIGLVPAHGAADLHDHVAADVGVLGQQEGLDLLLPFRHRRLGLFDFLAHQLALFARGLGEHFARPCSHRPARRSARARPGRSHPAPCGDGTDRAPDRSRPGRPGRPDRPRPRRTPPRARQSGRRTWNGPETNGMAGRAPDRVVTGLSPAPWRPARPSPCPCGRRSDAGSAPPGHRSRPASACR